jgi:hypothetical protein
MNNFSANHTGLFAHQGATSRQCFLRVAIPSYFSVTGYAQMALGSFLPFAAAYPPPPLKLSILRYNNTASPSQPSLAPPLSLTPSPSPFPSGLYRVAPDAYPFIEYAAGSSLFIGQQSVKSSKYYYTRVAQFPSCLTLYFISNH